MNQETFSNSTSYVLIRYQDSDEFQIIQSSKSGIKIGMDPENDFIISSPSSIISKFHGTLEQTIKYGIWVYVDHSEFGTMVNHKYKILEDAIVVKTGDVLKIGDINISLRFDGLDNSINHQLSIQTDNLIISNDHIPCFTNSPIPHRKNRPFATTSSSIPTLEYSSSPSIDRMMDKTVNDAMKNNKRAENLRIHVSKKMAGFIQNQFMKPSPPNSPVPYENIRKQNTSLQYKLQHRERIDEKLREEQEEWIKLHFGSNGQKYNLNQDKINNIISTSKDDSLNSKQKESIDVDEFSNSMYINKDINNISSPSYYFSPTSGTKNRVIMNHCNSWEMKFSPSLSNESLGEWQKEKAAHGHALFTASIDSSDDKEMYPSQWMDSPGKTVNSSFISNISQLRSSVDSNSETYRK